MTRVRKGAAAWRIHPGEILREEFLKPMKITPTNRQFLIIFTGLRP